MLNEFRALVMTLSVDFHDVLDFYSAITTQLIHWLLVINLRCLSLALSSAVVRPSVRLSVSCLLLNNGAVYNYGCYGTLIGNHTLEVESTRQRQRGPEIAEATMKLSPAPFEKHSLGG